MEQQTKSLREMSREERGKLIFERGRIAKKNDFWVVGSQTSFRAYKVRLDRENPICSCPDCSLRQKKCKHIYAVEFYIKKQIDEEGKITTTKGVRVTYSQDWKAYDTAQTNEKIIFMKLLKDLCGGVEQPAYEFGRPQLPIGDMIFASALKVYSTFSLRRFMSDLKIAKEMGLVETTCTYANICYFMNREDLTQILKELIAISSTPLREVDIDFAVDSSGFSTSRFARWFDYKWGKERKNRIWIKAHLCSGVKTNIVTGVKITEGTENDSPQLAELVRKTAEIFNMNEVSGDKAYNGRENFKVIEEVGATPFIPFKKNVTGKRGGCAVWKKMYHYFLYKHDEFLEHYHKRSNAETTFHMIKTKFKDNLRSKTPTAQVNELLLKILCHNICVVIQEILELGIKGEFIVEKEARE
ncbi:MAG: transposase [Nanoarchaeota archaeon]|nr:transposase [Nanoarchaeota archaeon]MBU0977877.1 transposase [Nanoarchaeota archaeon]